LVHTFSSDTRAAVQNNQLDKINEPNFMLEFATQDDGNKTGTTQLACSLAQMQDLVGKLKEASRRLELMGSS